MKGGAVKNGVRETINWDLWSCGPSPCGLPRMGRRSCHPALCVVTVVVTPRVRAITVHLSKPNHPDQGALEQIGSSLLGFKQGGSSLHYFIHCISEEELLWKKQGVLLKKPEITVFSLLLGIGS